MLDCVSGALVRALVPLLADDATIVTYGALDGETFGLGGSEIIGRQFVHRGVAFTRWFVDLSRDEQITDIRAAFGLADERPSFFKVAGVYGFANFREAISAVEAPNRDGYVLIKP